MCIYMRAYVCLYTCIHVYIHMYLHMYINVGVADKGKLNANFLRCLKSNFDDQDIKWKLRTSPFSWIMNYYKSDYKYAEIFIAISHFNLFIYSKHKYLGHRKFPRVTDMLYLASACQVYTSIKRALISYSNELLLARNVGHYWLLGQPKEKITCSKNRPISTPKKCSRYP